MKHFSKYHALGNDYLVVDPANWQGDITDSDIKILCNQQFGIGSDGVLFGPLASDKADLQLRIFNPDASEAEKSGNGLRIFARYLFDKGLVTATPFSIETKGGIVTAQVFDNGRSVRVEMGKVRFTHDSSGNPAIQLEKLDIEDKHFEFFRANVGNPHCVILLDDISPTLAKRYGPHIENSPLFANRTNVQFMKVLDRNHIQIEIWERGAGYTLASGSSSTAAAAVAHALGLCDENISVVMPGGQIQIDFTEDFHAIMTGAVCKIADGTLAEEALSSL